jgi:putative transposase
MRVSWVEREGMLSVTRQCELLGLHRSSLYYAPAGEKPLNLLLMRLLDEQFTRTPFYGSRRMTVWLRRMGYAVNRKRVQRLMSLMRLEAIYPRPHLSQGVSTHEKYPYLLGELEVMRPNQVWATDITYIRMRAGFLYLVAIMDWFSRYVLSWRLSNTLEVSFCLEALEEALAHGRPEIFNSDQGSQFTSQEFTSRLKQAEVRISMDSKGRVYDNIFVERLWRAVKYEEVYLKDYVAVPEVIEGIGDYFQFYNHERPHQALRYLTPAEVHFSRGREHTLN